MTQQRVPPVPDELVIPSLGTVEPLERLAWGKVTTVYRARLGDRLVALKIYRPAYIHRHFERHGTNIAEYEYSRNQAFRASPELRRYAAEPLGYLHTPVVSAFVQELLDGEMYYDACLERGGPLLHVFDHLTRIVEYAHAVDLFDIDLHAMNVLVVDEGGEEVPKLFDFNRIPFYLHPRNPFEALALKTGIIDERTRDRKKLRQFHNFRKLLRRRSRFLSPGDP
jgi:hypothetical protein